MHFAVIEKLPFWEMGANSNLVESKEPCLYATIRVMQPMQAIWQHPQALAWGWPWNKLLAGDRRYISLRVPNATPSFLGPLRPLKMTEEFSPSERRGSDERFSTLEPLQHDVQQSALQLLKHDANANAPQCDHDADAPELCPSVHLPEVMSNRIESISISYWQS